MAHVADRHDLRQKRRQAQPHNLINRELSELAIVAVTNCQHLLANTSHDLMQNRNHDELTSIALREMGGSKTGRSEE